MKEKQFAKLPLALLEIIIAYWIFTSLVDTMRSLRIRRNEVCSKILIGSSLRGSTNKWFRTIVRSRGVQAIPNSGLA